MPAKKTIVKGKKKAATKGVMKKTTAKGAYAKNKKATMVKRNAPMKETKKRVQSLLANYNAGTNVQGIPNGLTSDIFNVAKTYKIIIPWSLCSYNQGVTDSDMIGTNLFSKYLKAKFEFTVDSITNGGKNVPGGNGFPSEVYLIHGWCTVPVNSTLNTIPKTEDVDRMAFVAHVEEQVKQHFDGENDQLSFDSKKRTGIKILSKRRVAPNRNTQLSLPQQIAAANAAQDSYVAFGTIAPVNMSHTWRTMKKIHYTPGKIHVNPVGDTSFFLPNWSWIPFSLIYCPNALSQEAGQGVNYQYDNCHWYTDS